jgi:hypothetical protein
MSTVKLTSMGSEELNKSLKLHRRKAKIRGTRTRLLQIKRNLKVWATGRTGVNLSKRINTLRETPSPLETRLPHNNNLSPKTGFQLSLTSHLTLPFPNDPNDQTIPIISHLVELQVHIIQRPRLSSARATWRVWVKWNITRKRPLCQMEGHLKQALRS